jgi:hypothetical protein
MLKLTAARLPMLLLLAAGTSALADPGHPVAVRSWGDGRVTIETYWNLVLAIDTGATLENWPTAAGRPDLLVLTGASDPDAVPQARHIVSAADGPIGHVLDRPPNMDEPLLERSGAHAPTGHAIAIRSERVRGGAPLLVMEVDGVRIVHAGASGEPTLTDAQRQALGSIDVLLVGGDVDAAAGVVRRLPARLVVPLDITDDASFKTLASRVPPYFGTQAAVGNTLAVRQLGPTEAVQAMVVHLATRPWQMPAELARLFEAKERASEASQQVFAALSTTQMNHRPANGTHTPRWHAEHMMGRELGFFSSIYSKVDPMVPRIDLNPKQMPDDYVARHPDWTGREEARQMQRVEAFTRRFADLLDGMSLDELPSGCPAFARSLRGLLQIMARHYGEHTANVKKKFAEPDWPSAS